MPPLWSFGLWMSRITYFSEDEVRGVAAKLRQNRIPADVIHLDTGWFEHDWRCDYKFSTDPLQGPRENDRRPQAGWLSYLALAASLLRAAELALPGDRRQGAGVKDGKGNLPYEDAVLDFTNPAAVKWYQEKIAGCCAWAWARSRWISARPRR